MSIGKLYFLNLALMLCVAVLLDFAFIYVFKLPYASMLIPLSVQVLLFSLIYMMPLFFEYAGRKKFIFLKAVLYSTMLFFFSYDHALADTSPSDGFSHKHIALFSFCAAMIMGSIHWLALDSLNRRTL